MFEQLLLEAEKGVLPFYMAPIAMRYRNLTHAAGHFLLTGHNGVILVRVKLAFFTDSKYVSVFSIGPLWSILHNFGQL